MVRRLRKLGRAWANLVAYGLMCRAVLRVTENLGRGNRSLFCVSIPSQNIWGFDSHPVLRLWRLRRYRVTQAQGRGTTWRTQLVLPAGQSRPAAKQKEDSMAEKRYRIECHVFDGMGEDVKVVEVNAFKYNLKWDRKRQVLLDNEGRDVPFETWGKEADCG